MAAREKKTAEAEAIEPAKADEPASDVVEGIKGFSADLKCRDFQFEVGKTYEVSGKIVACKNGFHAVEGSPFDVWEYYGPADADGRLSRYVMVAQSGDLDRDSGDSKVASRVLTLKVELSLGEFVQRAVGLIIEATKVAVKVADRIINDDGGDSARIGSSGDSAQIGSSGDSAQIGSSGDSAQIGSSGYSARIGSSGYSARIGSSGYLARIGSSGDSAQIGSSGHSAKIGSSGDSAQIGSSGDSARIGSSGHSAKIGSSGDSAQITNTGKNAVVAAAGRATTFAGEVGDWVSIAEFDSDGKCIGFASGCIGQNGLKSGVAYRAKGGKLDEAA